MNIVVKSINFNANTALTAFVRKKVGKLFNHFSHIIRAHVVLRERENGSAKNRQCTIMLEVPGNDHIVEKQAEVHEKSVLQAVEALQKILRRKKTRLIAARQIGY